MTDDDFEAYLTVYLTSFNMSGVLKAWGRADSQTCFSESRWRMYLARIDGEAIGVGGLYIADGVGILGGAGTLPGKRWRGCHMALLRHRLRAAAKAGCDMAIAQCHAGSISQKNLERADFKLVYTEEIWTDQT